MSAQLEGVFNPTDFNPSMGAGGIPVSDKAGHLVTIVRSEMKATSGGDGTMLALTLLIHGGVNDGVEGNWNLNLGNASAQAVRIAQQHLACVCHAVGYVQALSDTEVLHNKEFRVVVQQQVKNPEYTNVTDVLRADGSKLSDPVGGSAAPTLAPGAPAPAPVAAAPQPSPFPAAPVAAPVAAPAPAPAPTPVAPAPAAAPAPGGAPWNQPPPQ